MTTRKTGTVTEVRYTHGGDGRQRTFIDGVEYATWWDILTRDWREGDLVEFDAVDAPLWADSVGNTLQARDIKKVQV